MCLYTERRREGRFFRGLRALGLLVRPMHVAAAMGMTLCFPLAAQVGPTRTTYGFHLDEFETISENAQAGNQVINGFDSAFPIRQAAPATTPLVSVDELRHPLTEKARRWLLKAFGYAKRGEHARAISTLREGMSKEAALVPYAHGLLGIEYLRTGRDKEAIPEFTTAAELFPHDAVVHANYAISLCVAGQFDHAEQETKLALYLEPDLESAQELLRMIEASKPAPSRALSK